MCKSCPTCSHKNKYTPETVLNICQNDNLFDKEGCGFVNPEFMQGIFLSVCDKINRPIVFMQKCFEDCKEAQNATAPQKTCEYRNWYDEKKCKNCNSFSYSYNNYYRLESNIFYNRLSTLCKYVRENKHINSKECACGYQRCLLSDSLAAAFFLDRASLNSNSFLDRVTYHDKNKFGREFIEYVCETTSYTELAFPVKLEEKIVGVLIVGQILLEKDKEKNDEFINAISKQYKPEHQFHKDKDLFNSLLCKDSEFKKIINDCCVAVSKLEERISNVLSMYRKWYIDGLSSDLLKKLQNFELDFKISDDGKLLSTQNVKYSYNKFKENICMLGYSLKEIFSANNAFYFMPQNIEDAVNNLNILYGFSSDNPQNDINIKFDLELFQKEKGKKEYTIINLDEIEKYIINSTPKKHYNNTPAILFVNAKKDKNNLPIAVLFVLSNKTSKIESENIFDALNAIMEQIKDPISIIASSIIYQFKEAEQRRSVQIMRHELGQSYSGFITTSDIFNKTFSEITQNTDGNYNISNYLLFPSTIHGVMENYLKNSYGFAHTAMLRIDSTRYSGGIPKPKKSFFYPYGEFLFKWKYIYQKNQTNKYLRFKMPTEEIYNNPDEYPLMFADAGMIEQVAFNLTNNAMKYSYLGSSVTLNCFADRHRGVYVLEVINYSQPLEENELTKIFDYGFSGKNHNESGTGLGLYISNEIAVRHNGTLSFEQEIVSDYNVPILTMYNRDLPALFFDEEIYIEVKSEINRLKHEVNEKGISKWNEIIGEPIHENPFTPLYIIGHIYDKTAKMKFTLEIPMKSR